MMKARMSIAVWGLILLLVSCGQDHRKPSHVYMPDMAYSRAYETYSSLEELQSKGIHYTAQPVKGTIKRGDFLPFPIEKDKEGDTMNYILSKQIPNPLPALNATQLAEAERLYLVNCGICHGAKLDGNGPLYKDGTGPYPAAPRNLVSDPYALSMPDGQLFYSITYGKNLMGGYGSQLSTTQRWMLVHYINSKQAPAGVADKK
jgi:mono/diheme cytochrome c family protein